MVEVIRYVVKADSGRGDGSKVKVELEERIFGVFIPWWHIHRGVVDPMDHAPVNWKYFCDWHRDRGLEVPEVVIPWWQGVVGDWVMADDGRILRVLGVGGFRDEKGLIPGRGRIKARRAGYIQTVIGTFSLPAGTRRELMDTDRSWHPDRYKLGRTVPGTYINPWQRGATRLKRDGVLKMRILRMVRMVMLGADSWQAYCSLFDRLPNARHHRMRYNDLINSQDYLEGMDEAIKGIAASSGWSAETVLKEYRDLYDKAKESLDMDKTSDARMKTNLMRDVLRDVSIITGMIGKQGNIALPLSKPGVPASLGPGGSFLDETEGITNILESRKPVEGEYEVIDGVHVQQQQVKDRHEKEDDSRVGEIERSLERGIDRAGRIVRDSFD